VSLFSFEIDPEKVLGVSQGATLGELRDAYRQKAKRYHPDAGGEDWAFRIVVQAYEMLSRARVVQAAHAEQATEHPVSPTRARPERPADSVHAGIFDKNVPPSRLVALELLCVRFLWDEADYVWITQRAPDDERFLSCSLNLYWPDPGPDGRQPAPADAPSVIAGLQEVFDQMLIATRVVSSRARFDDNRFDSWLSYSNFDRAWQAVRMIHHLLLTRGFGLHQWSRDLFIPRSGR